MPMMGNVLRCAPGASSTDGEGVGFELAAGFRSPRRLCFFIFEGVVQTMRHLRDRDDAGWRWALGGRRQGR
jgi:hypothetical protein